MSSLQVNACSFSVGFDSRCLGFIVSVSMVKGSRSIGQILCIRQCLEFHR